MIYTSETVLFTPYFIPMMLLIAAMSWREGASNLGAGAMALLLFIVLLWHNSRAFMGLVELAQSLI